MNLKVLLTTFLVVLNFILRGQTYEVKYHTDSNGYKYETVTNDPVGLRVYTLENGLKVYLAQNFDEPRIFYQTAIRAGSKYDPPQHTGLAHYLEHLIFNGTDKIGTLDWSKEKPLLNRIEKLYEQYGQEKDSLRKIRIYKNIDSISYEASRYGIKGEYRKLVTNLGGAYINGVTNVESVVFGCLINKNYLEKFLKLEKERFTKPAYRAFNTELEIVYEEFNTIQDNAFLEKYLTINKTIFKRHPYGQQPNIGKQEHLKNPSLTAINDYFASYYVPNNMAVILVGDIEFDKAIQYVDKTFGTLKPRPVRKINFPKEAPITKPIELEISSSKPESVFMGFRGNGVGSEDELFLTLIDKLLSNNVAGLLNLELKAKQKLKNARTYGFFINNDYSVQYLEGYPNTGQSHEEVKEQLLGVLEKIKKGEFDDWMITACVNDIRKSFIQEITTDQNLDAACAKLFTQFRSWSEKLAFLDKLNKITKQEIMDFAQRFYKDNYVVLYKKKGEAENLIKVENPKITPILLNDGAQSVFAKKFNEIPTGDINPEFVDYNNEIQKVKLLNGIPVYYVPNKSNNLFELNIIFDTGKNNDRKIALAADYINYTGTGSYTSEQLKKEFYKYGLTFAIDAQNTQTIFSIKGLPENFEKGIKLLDNIFSALKPDKDAYNSLVQTILNDRKIKKNNRDDLLESLRNFAFYGENSAFRNNYSEEDLKNTTPVELTDLIRDLRNYKHKIFYYGNNFSEAINVLNRDYKSSEPIKQFSSANIYLVKETQPGVFFINSEGAQTEVMIVARGNKFSKETIPLSNMFNRFIEKVSFKQIREARSLAYNNWSAHFMSPDSSNYDRMMMYAGTQTNKLIELLQVMTGLMKDISGMEAEFEEAKADQINRYKAERIRGTNIFWSCESFKKQGIQNDIRQDMYAKIRDMSFADITTFFANNIKGKEYAILIVGNKKDINMQALSLFGEIKEMDVDHLFNYK